VPRFTLPTSRAMVVQNIFVAPLLREWSGPKENTTMDNLSPDEIEFLIDLVMDYQDTRDLNQVEWGNTKVVIDKLDSMLGD
jgi:hypothetical protein